MEKDVKKLARTLSHETCKAMLKTIEWESPNKMRFESENKLFNKQTSLITAGNIVAHTITGTHVRNWWQLKHEELIRRPGGLFEFDMHAFKTWIHTQENTYKSYPCERIYN